MSTSLAAALAAPRTVRVLIADDHGIVRSALRSLLQTRPGIKVVAEAADGEETIVLIAQLAPDVALVDIMMPKVDGLSVVRHVAKSQSPTRVVALTAHEDDRYVRESLASGAAGYLLKSAMASEVFTAIEAVSAGRRYYDPRILDSVVNKHRHGTSGLQDLSPREAEVLRLIALGHGNKELAAKLSVSVKTIETYKARAMLKLGAHSRVDIVRIAIQRGWIAAERRSAGLVTA